MRTFSIQTLGCKVNQYESEQIATLLRSHGLCQVDSIHEADLRIVNSCSVTTEAASKSRQLVRRSIAAQNDRRGRIIVTGCWATSNKSEAENLVGDANLGTVSAGSVGAVLTHNDNLAIELDRLLSRWSDDESPDHEPDLEAGSSVCARGWEDEGSINLRAGSPGAELLEDHNPDFGESVKKNLRTGTRSLPLLDARHTGHQRAFLKIQDGCDAHCTYCIIPNLRPTLWSKPIDDAVKEAQNLVAAGHREIVLTGIFLGAFGQPTAIRKRQPIETARHFANLIEALCRRVPGLCRLRLSSLEPLDLTNDLIEVLKSHQQIVPHFHLPLQSGSDAMLRKMNRQYTRDDFLRMIDRVNASFDRPAITTDIIVGFPGETDEEFAQTLDVVDRAKFIHIHAFPFSARPGTAAARWKKEFIDPRITRKRIQVLTERTAACGFAFRQQFLGQEVEILVERPRPELNSSRPYLIPKLNRDGSYLFPQHGRCERYFDVHFEHARSLTGKSVKLRIDRVSPIRTFGTVIA